MKKYLLATMICLPLLIGCGGKGVWNWDSNGVTGTPTSKITSITPKVVLNKTTLSAASIRAALDTSGAQVTLILNDSAKTSVPLNLTIAGDRTYSFEASSAVDVKNFALNTAGDKYVWSIKIVTSGVTLNLKTEVPVMLGGTSLDSTTTDVISSITLSADVYGTVTYSYVIGYIPYGQTSTTTTTGTVPSGVKNSLPSLYLDKIVYVVSSTKETVLGSSEVSEVDYATPTFKAYFNQAISALPTTYSVTAKSGSTTVTFDSSTQGLITLALDATKKIVTITVAGQSGSSKLAADTSYEVTFKSATITADASAATATIAEGMTFKLKTQK